MRTRTFAAAVVLVLLFATSAAILAGVVSIGGDGNVADTPRPTATGEPPGGGGTETATSGSGSGGAEAQFRLTVDNVEKCGQTCRDVTTTLTNVGNATASDVFVRTKLFAGNGTDGSDQVWEGSEDVGTLAAGESYTTTKRVSLSFSGALAVQQADGWVTIQTTIRTADRTITFTEQRDVI